MSSGEVRTLLAELKSRSTKASVVHEQLQGGANLLSQDSNPIRAVLVHQRIDPTELRVLKGLKIQHRGRKYGISVQRSPYSAVKDF